MIRRRHPWIFLLLLALALALVPPMVAPRAASAHAFLVRTQPASGGVVAADAGEVRLTFTERVEVRPDRIAVIGADGQRVDRRDARTVAGEAAGVAVSLPRLANGVYTVTYALVSADTHPINGSFRFGVGVAPTDVLAAGPAENQAFTRATLLDALGRWLAILGLVLLGGPVAFRLFLLTAPAAGEDTVALFEGRAIRWLWGGTAVLVLGLVVSVVAASVGGAIGSFGAALTPLALLGTLTGRFGNLWLARLAILLIPALALPMLGAEQELREAEGGERSQRRGVRAWWAILLAAGALGVLHALGGHAAVTPPVALSVLVDWIHLAATVLWIGSLLMLACVMPGIVRSLGAVTGGQVLAAVVPRLSTLATLCVQALVVTGLYQAWAQVANPGALGDTTYGRTLLAKLALVVPLVALGAVNRAVIVPRLRDAAPSTENSAGVGTPAHPLWRVAWGEAALGLVVLLVVGLLTALPPARGALATAADSGAAGGATTGAQNGVTLAANAGSTLVTLTIGPTDNGPAVLSATLRDPAGVEIADAIVGLQLLPPDSGPARTVALTPRGGRYLGLGDFDQLGRWRIAAEVTPRGGQPGTARFALDLPTGGARALLAASDAAMNRLTSVRERQAIGAGGTPSVTEYAFAAPDRLQVRSDAGGETIAVGARRFDRSGGGSWIASVWPEEGGHRWPRYDYARTATEVTLLGREEVDGVSCWIVAFLDAGSGARFTFWIGERDSLVRRETMFAIGHYMDGRFYDFNAPIRIEAP